MTASVPPGTARSEGRRWPAPSGIPRKLLEALSDLAGLTARVLGIPATLIRAGTASGPGTLAAYGDCENPDFTERLVISLRDNADEPFGDLILLDRSPIALPPEKARLAESLARQAAALMELGMQASQRPVSVEEQFRDILELVPDAMLLHAQGRILYANAAMVRLAGAGDAAALSGMPVTSVFAPEAREAAEGRVEDAYEKGLPTARRTYAFRRHDGKEIPLELASLAIRMEDRDCRLVVARDLSGREAAETRTRSVPETWTS